MKLMTKKTLVTLSLAITLALSFAVVSKVHSLEFSASAEAMSIITDVVGLDTTKYDVALVSNFVDYFEHWGGLAVKDVTYAFSSNGNSFDVCLKFVKNRLSWCKLYAYDDSPIFAQSSTDTLSLAKDLLQRYQSYSSAEYLKPMQSMLDSVDELKNMTTTSGNVKFELSINGNRVKMDWIYTSNGIDFPGKGVHFKFKNGRLESFSDGWFFINIGSDSLNVSEEEAIAIAKDAAPKNVSWTVNLFNGTSIEVRNVNIVDDHVKAEFHVASKEPLTLYPAWKIHLYFDKLYPGNVYGIEVTLWADSGEVIGTQPKALMGSVSEEEPSQSEYPLELTDLTSTEPAAPQSSQPTDSPTQQETNIGLILIIGLAATAAIIAMSATTVVALKKRSK